MQQENLSRVFAFFTDKEISTPVMLTTVLKVTLMKAWTTVFWLDEMIIRKCMGRSSKVVVGPDVAKYRFIS